MIAIVATLVCSHQRIAAKGGAGGRLCRGAVEAALDCARLRTPVSTIDVAIVACFGPEKQAVTCARNAMVAFRSGIDFFCQLPSCLAEDPPESSRNHPPYVLVSVSI